MTKTARPAARQTPVLTIRRRAGAAVALWLAMVGTGGLHGGETRAFRSNDGGTVWASFEGVAGNKILLRRSDGKTFEIAREILSAPDRKYVDDLIARNTALSNKINLAAGHALSDGSMFSQRQAAPLAEALQLRPESQTKYGRSWRLYASRVKDYRLFGAMPYSVALYAGADGCLTSMSIVYANKGDFGSTAGTAEDHFNGDNKATTDELIAAMKRDDETVAKALTAALGAGKSQRYGEGDTRRTITRWDALDHAFLLSHEPDEYVALSIVSTEQADLGGKSSRMRDGDLKKRLLDSIVRSPNGDVLLTEIPMVDQGPKGYCVPATFERVMRAMGLEADMYLLAMQGQTKTGGGTVVELLLDSVRSQVYRKGRRTRDESFKELRLRELRRYLDQGIPIMWTMHSVADYNRVANDNTQARANVTDWDAYAKSIAAAAKALTATAKPATDEKRHICMIIGYNDATAEIAVSDSWGPRFECRWVPLSVANWANAGHAFMILP